MARAGIIAVGRYCLPGKVKADAGSLMDRVVNNRFTVDA